MSSSKLSIGIVGLPNVGKSTLFSALTKNKVEIANYPFATIDPNVGVVEVPDERLGQLADLSHSKKIVLTVIEFVDIAGLVKGAHQGEVRYKFARPPFSISICIFGLGAFLRRRSCGAPESTQYTKYLVFATRGRF